MAFQVDFTRRANSDLTPKPKWLAQLGSHAVRRWRVRLLRIVENLETDPHRYPQAAEAPIVGIDLREALFGRRPHVHRVLFSIDAQTVTIQRIRHAAQDLLTQDDVDQPLIRSSASAVLLPVIVIENLLITNRFA